MIKTFRSVSHGTRMCAALSFSLILVSAPSVAQERPPTAPVHPVTDVYFGRAVMDPYRWMEDMQNPELLAWIKQQDAYARNYLQTLRIHDEFLRRERDVQTKDVFIDRVRQQGQRYVYLKSDLSTGLSQLFVRDGFTGAERLLVSAGGAAAHSPHQSIEEFDLSPDGHYVSYLLSTEGREVGDLHVVDANTGVLQPDIIPGTRMILPVSFGITGFPGTSWAPDSRSFVYRKLESVGSFQNSRLLLHTLGTDQTHDRVLFGPGVTPSVTVRSTIPFVWFVKNSSYVIAQVGAPVEPHKEFFVVALSHFQDQPIPWRKVNDLEDQVRDISVGGDNLFLRSYKNAPRFEILRVSADHADVARAPVVFPASEAVVETSAPAKDGFYVQTLEGGTRKIYRLSYGTWKRQPIPIPANTSARIAASDPIQSGILLSLESWTEPPRLGFWHPDEQRLANVDWTPPPSVRMPDLTIETRRVRSHDGVLVPLVVISPRSRAADRTRPTILYGYGASGVEWTSPFFAPGLIPWLERGGVVAYAGVRGGGEYGEEWQQAGTGVNKPNTWKDFLACAEYLVRERHTRAEQVGVVAGSNGGILAGNALAERPDLFGALVILAGQTNPLRYSFTAFGQGHPEFGRIGTREDFEATLAMDAYQKIKNGVNYPAVLLRHGINDPRIAPYFSAKFAARLQAASTSRKPVLLEINYNAGHGGLLSPEDFADQFAFLFESLSGTSSR